MISKDGIKFDGNLSFTVDNTYYTKITEIQPNPSAASDSDADDSQSPGVTSTFQKTVNFVRNSFTATVFFPGANECVTKRLFELGLIDPAQSINIGDIDTGAIDIFQPTSLK